MMQGNLWWDAGGLMQAASLQALAWLGWSGRREVFPVQKCILAFCTLTGSNTALWQQNGWHQIKILK